MSHSSRGQRSGGVTCALASTRVGRVTVVVARMGVRTIMHYDRVALVALQPRRVLYMTQGVRVLCPSWTGRASHRGDTN